MNDVHGNSMLFQLLPLANEHELGPQRAVGFIKQIAGQNDKIHLLANSGFRQLPQRREG